ncbi:hypothetical protein ACFL1V_04300 [Pseudomonadota bacterium]
MHKLTKKGVGAIAVLTIAVVATWILLTQFQKPNGSADIQTTEPAPAIASTAGKTDTDLDQAESINADSSADERRGKRIVEVPDTRQKSETSASPTEQEFADSMSEKIESALAGDSEDAWTTALHAYNCKEGPQDEASLHRSIERLRDGRGFPTLSQGPGLIDKHFDSIDEWAEIQWRRIQDCQSAKDLFGDDARSRVKALAENGNVAARFMYAMWPPPVQSELEAVFDWLEYTNLAYEFSIQNVNEGEPLGFLALGLSYSGIGYFTPLQPYIGEMLLLAAEKCGIQNIIIGDMAMRLSGARLADQTRGISEALALEFCE